jgi:hypothetical protein
LLFSASGGGGVPGCRAGWAGFHGPGCPSWSSGWFGGGQPGARACRRVGFPRAGGPVEGEHLHPGSEFAGHRDQLALDLVLCKSVQGQIAQPGVFGGADPVLAPGAAAVPQAPGPAGRRAPRSRRPGGPGRRRHRPVPRSGRGGHLPRWRIRSSALPRPTSIPARCGPSPRPAIPRSRTAARVFRSK